MKKEGQAVIISHLFFGHMSKKQFIQRDLKKSLLSRMLIFLNIWAKKNFQKNLSKISLKRIFQSDLKNVHFLTKKFSQKWAIQNQEGIKKLRTVVLGHRLGQVRFSGSSFRLTQANLGRLCYPLLAVERVNMNSITAVLDHERLRNTA